MKIYHAFPHLHLSTFPMRLISYVRQKKSYAPPTFKPPIPSATACNPPSSSSSIFPTSPCSHNSLPVNLFSFTARFFPCPISPSSLLFTSSSSLSLTSVLNANLHSPKLSLVTLLPENFLSSSSSALRFSVSATACSAATESITICSADSLMCDISVNIMAEPSESVIRSWREDSKIGLDTERSKCACLGVLAGRDMSKSGGVSG